MPTWLRTIIGIVVVAVLGVGGLFLYQMSQSQSNDYATIAQHWTKSGKFIDYSQDTGVASAEDLHYFVNNEKERVEISYGYVQLIYSFEELEEQETVDALKYIGLTFEKNKKGDDYRFYWKGEQLEPWAKSNIVAG